MSTTLADVITAAEERRLSLTGDVAGYLALSLAELLLARPVAVPPRGVQIDANGRVTLVEVAPGIAGADGVRRALARLLQSSRRVSAALDGVAGTPEPDLAQLARSIEAALIPFNRAAAQRALGRTVRDTAKAFAAHGLAAKTCTFQTDDGPQDDDIEVSFETDLPEEAPAQPVPGPSSAVVAAPARPQPASGVGSRSSGVEVLPGEATPVVPRVTADAPPVRVGPTHAPVPTPPAALAPPPALAGLTPILGTAVALRSDSTSPALGPLEHTHPDPESVDSAPPDVVGAPSSVVTEDAHEALWRGVPSVVPTLPGGVPEVTMMPRAASDPGVPAAKDPPAAPAALPIAPPQRAALRPIVVVAGDGSAPKGENLPRAAAEPRSLVRALNSTERALAVARATVDAGFGLRRARRSPVDEVAPPLELTYRPRKSDVDELLSRFGSPEPVSDADIAAGLKYVAGIDLTPAPVALEIEAPSSSEDEAGQAAHGNRGTRRVGVVGAIVGTGLFALVALEVGGGGVSSAAASGERCRAELVVEGVERGSSVVVRSRTGETILSRTQGDPAPLAFDDLVCGEGVDVVVSHRSGRWSRLPVSASDLTGAPGAERVSHRVKVR